MVNDMKAITFEAPQSRNLTLTTNLDRPVFKSVSKSQVRRLWLRLNLAVRSWSRRTVARYGTLLVWVWSIAALAGFFSAAFDNDALTAIFAFIVMAAMIPEMTKMTYEEDEL